MTSYALHPIPNPRSASPLDLHERFLECEFSVHKETLIINVHAAFLSLIDQVLAHGFQLLFVLYCGYLGQTEFDPEENEITVVGFRYGWALPIPHLP